MDRTDIGAAGLAASLALVVVAIVISRRERLRLERDMVIAIVRSLAQMLVVASALELIVKPSTPPPWSPTSTMPIDPARASPTKRG